MTLPSRKSDPADDPKDLVAAALNEHGFLLQHVLRKKLTGMLEHDPGADANRWGSQWRCVAAEYPVTAADGSQTRIDLLLKSQIADGVYVCMECKRPHPKFKKWVFFDRESNVEGMHDLQINLETVLVTQDSVGTHRVFRLLARHSTTKEAPLFSYYVEAAVKRDGSASNTEAIEKAFYQLMKGHSGLMAKLESSSQPPRKRSIPVVVTTAELLEAKFESKQVSIESGMVEAGGLTLAPMEFCAVNCRADDSLALKRLPQHERSVGPNDLLNAQIRTVFVVRATAINRFLTWASANLISDTCEAN